MHIVLAPGECRAGGLIRFVIIKKRACERTATRNKTSNIVSVRSIVLYNKSTIRTKTGSRTHSRYTLLLYLHKVHIHLRKFQVEKKKLETIIKMEYVRSAPTPKFVELFKLRIKFFHALHCYRQLYIHILCEFIVCLCL